MNAHLLCAHLIRRLNARAGVHRQQYLGVVEGDTALELWIQSTHLMDYAFVLLPLK